MTDENIIVGSPLRSGKTLIMEIAKETGISPEEIIKIILKNASYKYNYSMTDITKEAMEMERRHRLNCSDRPIDSSPEAENQRILNNIKRLKKQRGYI
ncbi:MAG: hypothetical protein IJ258_05140 [Methanobrevibacter sp.]|uniref:hypothetical protein n=1 Tax=Methanobrevibacter sp. TaxID=66852 RepID=UPI0025E3D89A|nr:hypothetical protein [Methanobrevibacter sp.]MBQ8017474.1 hypothetical protein [Methanobrevibacter sp.]